MNLPTTPTDKLATMNTRSDAASANEAATAVAGATVSKNAGSDTVPTRSIPAETVPAWKAACHIDPSKDNGFNIHSPTRAYYYTDLCGWSRYMGGPNYNPHNVGSYSEKEDVEEDFAACTVPPPDWPTPAHTDDPREEPERFCEATGPVAEHDEPGPRGSCFRVVLDALGVSGPMPRIVTSKDGRAFKVVFEPPITYHATGPVETVTYSDPSPCGTFVRKITKPAEPIEKLIDRLAHIRDCHKIDWQFQIRVTGDVEKAEPRSYDSPGYPEHFALHHVYLGEDLTRAILTTIAYDLDSKGMDKPTVRKVLESVARAFQLTAEFGETDLIGMAVAVEDKLDIGKE